MAVVRFRLNHEVIAASFLLFSIISAILFGANAVQTFFYFQCFPRDKKPLKTMIACLLTLQALHTALTMDAVYQVFVINHADSNSLSTLPISFDVSIVVSGVILAMVLYFHSHRIKALMGSGILQTLCLIATTTRNVLLLLLGVLLCIERSLPRFFDRWGALAIAASAIAAISDINGTVVVVLCLRKRKKTKDLPRKSTGDIAAKIILWTIETGLTRSTFMLALVTCIAVQPMHCFAWLGLLTIAPGIYTNTLLASLNGRMTLRRFLTEDILNFSELGPFNTTTPALSKFSVRSRATQLEERSGIEDEEACESGTIRLRMSGDDKTIYPSHNL